MRIHHQFLQVNMKDLFLKISNKKNEKTNEHRNE